MRGLGYGREPYGRGLYGRADWAYHALYKELPPRLQDQDAAAGGYYEKFVRAVAMPLNRLRSLANDMDILRDPSRMRQDLLLYYGKSMGLDVDRAEDILFQRTAADLWARFIQIKGQPQSFVVLARVHGFEATVQELWWDGSSYSPTQTGVSHEQVGTVSGAVTAPSGGSYGEGRFGDMAFGGGSGTGDITVTGRLKCAPLKKGTLRLYHSFASVTDDGAGNLVGDGNGTIDYRTGAFTATIAMGTPGDPIYADYMPKEGGCGCGSCKTNKFRLVIVPGTVVNAPQLSITDAFTRLVSKIKDVIPIHAVWSPEVQVESITLSYTNLFDVIPADAQNLDTGGLRVTFT